ncbi:MAG: GIY-YIG nuclease family protein [Pseudomonadota bacterium]
MTKAGPIVADRLKSFIERIERLNAREAARRAELSVALAEFAAAVGRRPGFTYVAQADSGLVKIGRTMDPEERIKALKGACGSHVRLLRLFYFDCERDLHAMFAHCRHQGEWFAFDPAMLTVEPVALQ